MASKLKPTPPAFEARPKAPQKAAKKSRDSLAEPAPKKAQKAVQPVLVPKVTAGPFFDDRHPRPHEGWVVITRAGDIVTYHRFRTKEQAAEFAGTLSATPTP